MSLEPSIETVDRGEKPPIRYVVESEIGRLRGSPWQEHGHDDFDYALTWSRETSEELDDVLEDLTAVFVYGEIDLGQKYQHGPVFRDFFDSDEDHWGCDFGEGVVDARAPSREKLVSDTLVELYAETADIAEEEAYQMLEAFQQEVP